MLNGRMQSQVIQRRREQRPSPSLQPGEAFISGELEGATTSRPLTQAGFRRADMKDVKDNVNKRGAWHKAVLGVMFVEGFLGYVMSPMFVRLWAARKANSHPGPQEAFADLVRASC